MEINTVTVGANLEQRREGCSEFDFQSPKASTSFVRSTAKPVRGEARNSFIQQIDVNNQQSKLVKMFQIHFGCRWHELGWAG